jgi:hypothetical protein
MYFRHPGDAWRWRDWAPISRIDIKIVCEDLVAIATNKGRPRGLSDNRWLIRERNGRKCGDEKKKVGLKNYCSVNIMNWIVN